MKWSKFFALIFYVSCASMNEEECKNGNWNAIGIKDGINGSALNQYKKHEEACSKYGVSVDLAEYKNGRNEGLQTYCTPENGYEIGSNGKKYYNVCSNQKFNKNYKLGRKVYELESEIHKLENEIKSLEKEDKEASVLEHIFTPTDVLKKKKELRKKEAQLLLLNAEILKSSPELKEYFE